MGVSRKRPGQRAPATKKCWKWTWRQTLSESVGASRFFSQPRQSGPCMQEEEYIQKRKGDMKRRRMVDIPVDARSNAATLRSYVQPFQPEPTPTSRYCDRVATHSERAVRLVSP